MPSTTHVAPKQMDSMSVDVVVFQQKLDKLGQSGVLTRGLVDSLQNKLDTTRQELTELKEHHKGLRLQVEEANIINRTIIDELSGKLEQLTLKYDELSTRMERRSPKELDEESPDSSPRAHPRIRQLMKSPRRLPPSEPLVTPSPLSLPDRPSERKYLAKDGSLVSGSDL